MNRTAINAEWKGIYDDKGRVVVAICHNMDLGDAWEWSDEPEYPAEWANMAYRIAHELLRLRSQSLSSLRSFMRSRSQSFWCAILKSG